MPQPNTSSTPITTIRPAVVDDAAQITEILNWYVANSIAIWAVRPIPESFYPPIIAERITQKLPFYVATVAKEEGGGQKMIGYAFASFYKPARLGYSTTLELSIYLDPNHKAKGVGTQLLTTVVNHLETKEYLAFGEGGSLDTSAAYHTATTSNTTGTSELVGIPVKCKVLIASMAIDSDESVDKQVCGFYLKHGFEDIATEKGFGYKFGKELSSRMLVKRLNDGYLPCKEVGGI